MPNDATIRVLFMGTPDFAVPSLRALMEQANAGLAVAGVVTRPDKAVGRKQQVIFSPIKQSALGSWAFPSTNQGRCAARRRWRSCATSRPT